MPHDASTSSQPSRRHVTIPGILADTVREFHANEPKRIRLDDFIEQSAGRPMSAEERSAAMRHLAATLREKALRKQKQERKRP
jgi:hypothetical protein